MLLTVGFEYFFGDGGSEICPQVILKWQMAMDDGVEGTVGHSLVKERQSSGDAPMGLWIRLGNQYDARMMRQPLNLTKKHPWLSETGVHTLELFSWSVCYGSKTHGNISEDQQ